MRIAPLCACIVGVAASAWGAGAAVPGHETRRQFEVRLVDDLGAAQSLEEQWAVLAQYESVARDVCDDDPSKCDRLKTVGRYWYRLHNAPHALAVLDEAVTKTSSARTAIDALRLKGQHLWLRTDVAARAPAAAAFEQALAIIDQDPGGVAAFPHRFHSIAWMLSDEYRKAGRHMDAILLRARMERDLDPMGIGEDTAGIRALQDARDHAAIGDVEAALALYHRATQMYRDELDVRGILIPALLERIDLEFPDRRVPGYHDEIADLFEREWVAAHPERVLVFHRVLELASRDCASRAECEAEIENLVMAELEHMAATRDSLPESRRLALWSSHTSLVLRLAASRRAQGDPAGAITTIEHHLVHNAAPAMHREQLQRRLAALHADAQD